MLQADRPKKNPNGIIIIKVLNYAQQFNDNLLILTLTSVLYVFFYYLLLFFKYWFYKELLGIGESTFEKDVLRKFQVQSK